jgi:predicted acylesterase/phospholipase RssA
MNKRKERTETLVNEVRAILSGHMIDPEAADRLARQLIELDIHYWARRLLLKLLSRKDIQRIQRIRLVQGLALATYKDTSLLQVEAFDTAQALLAAEFDLKTTEDQETLGLVGALYKRRWRLDHRQLWLEQSLHYYRRGFECGVLHDAGYTAINAAYIQDLLAHIESQSHHSTASFENAQIRRSDARTIREQVIAELRHNLPEAKAIEKSHYWLMVTVAEAYLGIGDNQQASRLLQLAADLKDIPDWWRKSTVEQLTHLIQVQSVDQDVVTLNESTAWSAVKWLMGDAPAKAAETLFSGKVGLALSGGGFRASFYHLGILAKLAELDMLRHIEVISCVSGGSIVGAHYYLELRRLIQFAAHEAYPMKRGLSDKEITHADYLALMDTLINDFLEGVQKNLRMRVLASPIANLKMLFLPAYSRTEYLGELYEKHLYSRVKDSTQSGTDNNAPRFIKDMIIQPPDEATGFRPGNVNWRRCNKIPQLILNATTLNTGHVWQFTVTWMGESPNMINREIDKNPRLRRLYYQEAPEERYENFRLGHAVAASSCVPGLFEPIELPNLYPGNNIRLVDGGVFDNQGYVSLLEQDCTVLLISDASGQLTTDEDPAGGVLGPILRSNSVMMERIRGSGYEDLHARRRSGLLKGLTYVHLTQGLDSKEINWHKNAVETEPGSTAEPITSYGIRRNVQHQLSKVRTDLDSFNDIEAMALMNSGYHAMAEAASRIKGFPLVEAVKHEWGFRELDDVMQSTTQAGAKITAKQLDQQLKVSPMKFFKVWRLSKGLFGLAMGFVVTVLVGVGYWTIKTLMADPQMSLMSTDLIQSAIRSLTEMLTLQNLVGGLLFLLLGYGMLMLFGKRMGKRIMQFLKPRSVINRATIGLGIGLVGWLFPRLHITLFDRLYLHIGRMRR